MDELDEILVALDKVPAHRDDVSLRGVLRLLDEKDGRSFENALLGSGANTIGDLRSKRGGYLLEVLQTLPGSRRDRLGASLIEWLGERASDAAPAVVAAVEVSLKDGPPRDPAGVARWAEERGVSGLLYMTIHELRRQLPDLPRLSWSMQLTVRDLLMPQLLPASWRDRDGPVFEVLREAAVKVLLQASDARKKLFERREAFLAQRGEPATPHERAFDEALAALITTDGTFTPRTLPIIGYPAETITFRGGAGATLTVQPGLKLGYVTPEIIIDVPGLMSGNPRALEVRPAVAPIDLAPTRATGVAMARDLLRDPESETREALAQWLGVPAWKRTLERMETRSTPRVEIDESAREERLAFRIATGAGPVTIDVLVQSRRKNGDYTAGRATELERAAPLAEGDLETTILDELWALEAASHERDTLAERRLLRALTAVADHPRVVWKDGRPARVRRARLTFSVESLESEGDLHALRLSIGDSPREPRDILATVGKTGLLLDADDATATLRILDVDAATHDVVAALAAAPTHFPREALDTLLGILQRTQETADLRLPDALRGRDIAADSDPIARVWPLGNGGLRLEIIVRPIAGGPPFEPANGPTTLLGTLSGARVSAHRRVDEERERAERLLADLPLGDADRDGPWGASINELDSAADVLVALAEATPPVRVEWPKGDAISLVKAERRHLRMRVDRRRDWFGVDGELTVDDAHIALADLLAAARAGHRFVRIGKTRIVALARDLRERLLDADDALLSRGKDLEAPSLALPALDALVEDTSQIDAAASWIKMRTAMQRASTLDPALPEGLVAELRPYQREGFQWLARVAAWGAGGCLADDMGLGKTIQTLALLLYRASDGPALVVAPTTVGPNWIVEANRFAPSLRMHSYRGPGRQAILADLGPGDVVVTSYDLVARDAETLSAVHFATLVLDEAQAVKNAASRRAAAARGLSADVRIALSGTPVENHLGELWSIFRIVSPGLLGGWERFRDRFAGPIERERDPVRQAALARLLRPFLLRRTKREVAPELPARTETVRIVELSPEERARYEAERISAMALAEGSDPTKERFAVLAAITRLRRLACHPRLVDEGSTIPSSKLAAFLEIASELREAGHRALVFSQFTTHLALVREALDAMGTSYLYLDGSTPSAERQRLVRAFQAGEGEMFLLSLKAGGTGINLTAADYVVHLDPWWNPAAEDQATDRAHRIGQSRPVTVVRLVARGTIEEAVLSLHDEKRALAESLLAGGELAGSLSAAELVALVRKGEDEAASDDLAADAPAPRAPEKKEKPKRGG